MSLVVKICGLRSADQVAAAVDAGADAVGFVFAESIRRIAPADARAACAAVPDKVYRVAVMRHPAGEVWNDVLRIFQPDVLQTDIEDYASLDVPDGVIRWPVIREGSAMPDGPLPDIFLYEGAASGRGETVDWSRAAEISSEVSDRTSNEHSSRGGMLLAGGLDPGNVADAIRIVRPRGVDVSSGVESQPGEKDPDLIQRFIRAARAAENDS